MEFLLFMTVALALLIIICIYMTILFSNNLGVSISKGVLFFMNLFMKEKERIKKRSVTTKQERIGDIFTGLGFLSLLPILFIFPNCKISLEYIAVCFLITIIFWTVTEVCYRISKKKTLIKSLV